MTINGCLSLEIGSPTTVPQPIVGDEMSSERERERILGKLHFTTLNYALNYTLHHKLSNCTFCTINYHTYHTLHPDVIFAVIFNRILLHVTSTCFLLRWNKIKRVKQLSLKSIKTKLKNFHISLCLTWCHPLPHPPSLVKRNATSLKA